jgi:hypothetical protein
MIFGIQIAVFTFSDQSDIEGTMRALFARAGYASHEAQQAARTGGFMSSDSPAAGAQYCRGSNIVTFSPVDSAQYPRVIAIQRIQGEPARQSCALTRANPARSFPVTIPLLTPPAGAMAFGSGSSWSGASGETSSTLRTTMPADSILRHYTAQLLSANWKVEGAPALSSGIAMQRFTVRDGDDSWSAGLVVMLVGDQREVRILFKKID